MEESEYWMGDGIFNMSPPNFSQIYIIQYKLFSRTITGLYCVMKGRTELDYYILFSAIKSLKWNVPKYYIIDHENACMKSLKIQFPDIIIKLCLFHMGQSLYKQIQSLQLASEFNSSKNVRLCCKMLSSLAFVPIENVAEVFVKLKAFIISQNNPKLTIFAEFFEKNYIIIDILYFNF